MRSSRASSSPIGGATGLETSEMQRQGTFDMTLNVDGKSEATVHADLTCEVWACCLNLTRNFLVLRIYIICNGIAEVSWRATENEKARALADRMSAMGLLASLTLLNGYEPLLPIRSQRPIYFICFSPGPDVVQQHWSLLPQDKAALAAKILNQAEKQHQELCQTKVRPSATLCE